MSYMKRTALILFSVLTTAAADEGSRDGNWWNSLPASQRNAYVLGMFDEIQATGQPGVVDKANYDAMNSRLKPRLSRIMSDQLADGMTAFYKDFRNRLVPTCRAIWIAVDAINGIPSEQIALETEQARRAASVPK
jgi:hypothetical protein